MSNAMKRTIFGIFVFFVALAICWYGGADLEKREIFNALLLVLCIIVGLFAASCPLFFNDEE